jgi:hypothetical protein
MRKPPSGTAPPKVFAVELGPSWKRWARRRTKSELEEINQRLLSLVEAFGRPHAHAGLGVRRLHDNAFEFRLSRGIRVIFLFFKPNKLRLMMTGSHDEVSAWLKGNL